MPSMMIAVSPKTLRKRSLSWVLKPSMWASIRVWISVGGLLATITLSEPDALYKQVDLVNHGTSDNVAQLHNG